jgi:hypothetical protein
VYRKTGLGVSEISSTRRSVDFRLRPLLILVDGQRSALRIQALLGGDAAADEHFNHLADAGYIEAIGRADPSDGGAFDATAYEPPQTPDSSQARRFIDGQRYMIETAEAKLGLMSFLFVLRIEKCNSIEDLVALLPEFELSIARRLDADFARHCRRLAQALMLA